MRTWNVGVIGGGPGGLMTAYSLQKAANSPLRITLFEASGRLGGKILTPQFQTLPANYEAGAAEFYDYSPVDDDPLKALIAEVGLSIQPIGGSAVIMDHRILTNLEDIRDHLGLGACNALMEFDRAAKDWMTPREYYDSDHGDCLLTQPVGPGFDEVLGTIKPSETRRYVESMIHSDLATEPARTSASYGLQNYLMNDTHYMQLYSIEGGNQRLPEELARRVHATKLLQHVVTDVARGPNGKLVVRSKHAGGTREDAFDFVVVALPHNCLPSVQFHGERLTTAMQSHHDHYDHPAHYLRISVLFERPFWRTKLNDAYFMLDQFGGCCLYDESLREPGSKHGVLAWLLAGEQAQEMSELDDATLIERALESLPEPLADGREYFLEGKVHRWMNAVNAIPGGRTPRGFSRRHQPEPFEHPDLFVVGDYMYDSTLNGVLDSAENVAEWLAAHMIDHS